MLVNCCAFYSMMVSRLLVLNNTLLSTLRCLADNVWFEHFRQQLIAARNEYLALSSHCLQGGESAAIDFVLNRHVSSRARRPSRLTDWLSILARHFPFDEPDDCVLVRNVPSHLVDHCIQCHSFITTEYIGLSDRASTTHPASSDCRSNSSSCSNERSKKIRPAA